MPATPDGKSMMISYTTASIIYLWWVGNEGNQKWWFFMLGGLLGCAAGFGFFCVYVGGGDKWGAVCFGLCVCVEVSTICAGGLGGGGGRNFHMLRTKEKIGYR